MTAATPRHDEQDAGATIPMSPSEPRPYVQRQDIALGQLFSLAQDMLCIAGFDGYFKQVNPAWERVLGWSAEELTSQPFANFVHPLDRDKTSAEVTTLVDGLETMQFENRYRCRDGSYRWLSWTSSPSTAEQLIYAAARDVTAAKHNAQMVAARHAVTTIAAEATEWESTHGSILEAVCGALGWELGALWLVDSEGDALTWHSAFFANDEMREAHGESVGRDTRRRGESLVGRAWECGEPLLSEDILEDPRFTVPSGVAGRAMGGGFAFPIRSAGEVVGVMVFASSDTQLLDVDLRTAVTALADQVDTLRERLEAAGRMRHLAFHDTLTGLPNLALFRERANQALQLSGRSGASVGIAVADVDRFKLINDTFGHSAGDEVLRHVGSCLAGALRASDTVARLGGDEFGIVFPATTESGMEAGLRKLRKALAAGIAIGDDRLLVNVSLGYAVSSGADHPLDELLRAADRQMYSDKAQRSVD